MSDAPNESQEKSSKEEKTELSPLRSIHTSNFPEILSTLNCSLVVSTYQAGRLILLRADGDKINTHFRGFNKPMGVAVAADRMAIGTAMEIIEFRNIPAVAKKVDENRPPDACFLPRTISFTGDIQIHEMDWGWSNALNNQSNRQVDLWFINTRFSCLCTRSADHSFYPQWRPKFVTAIAPQDRCHLNGLCVVDGKPKYVTALGESDEPGGWRDNKASGGIVMDIESNEVIARGLSMPHSPRFHEGKLWVLNSGAGGIGFMDQATGKYESVTKVPGFTRGFSIQGRIAFIGLSQVRESAIFSGIEIAQRPESERWSGVAVVDLSRGETVAWMRFEDAVQEVFAVSVLPNRTWPDLINDDPELIGLSYVLPDEALKDVPDDMRSTS